MRYGGIFVNWECTIVVGNRKNRTIGEGKRKAGKANQSDPNEQINDYPVR